MNFESHESPAIDAEMLLQLSRLATVGEMAGAISHELNQPLTAIANYAQAGKWLLESKPPELLELADSLHEITAQAMRAAELIKRLRSLIQKGEAQRELTTLDTVINDIKGLTTSEARMHTVKLTFDTHPELPSVDVDRLRIQQVLLNLLRNAFEMQESTPREQRAVNVQTTMQADGNVEVSVSDSGSGIPSKSNNEMFHLRLSISRTIVEAHDGALGYRSKETGGAVFFFTLPAAKKGES